MKIKGIDITRPVKVYRNLKHGKNVRPLYSVMQDGKVKARLHRVLLSSAVFVVNEPGRQRVIKEKRKNVHAFVIGLLVNMSYTPKGEPVGCFGIDETGRDFGLRIHYNPYEDKHFIGEQGQPLEGADGVLLNERGITATYAY